MGQGLEAWGAECPDYTLLEAIANQRSTRAFETLFNRYAPRLKAFFMGSGRSSAQAEDLAQEVLISVWHHAESYRAEKAAVSTWLFRIARNRFIDVVRRERYVELEPETPDVSTEGDRPALPDETLAEQQLSERVAAALSDLSEEQAEVVHSSFYRHESASQIAARLAIPIGTVKSRLRAALTHLQQRLFDEQES